MTLWSRCVFLHTIFLFFVFERANYFLQKSLCDRALRHVRRRRLMVSTEEKKVIPDGLCGLIPGSWSGHTKDVGLQ